MHERTLSTLYDADKSLSRSDATSVSTTAICNIKKNRKDIFKKLFTRSTTSWSMTDISMCQELIPSNTAARLSSASAGRKDSSNRLSTKSPAKGEVPMMDGQHTKASINSSW